MEGEEEGEEGGEAEGVVEGLNQDHYDKKVCIYINGVERGHGTHGRKWEGPRFPARRHILRAISGDRLSFLELGQFAADDIG